MKKKIGLFCWHASAWSVRITLSALLLLAVAVSIFVWRVNSAPLDVSLIKDYIEWALRDTKSGAYAKTGNVVLYWPDLQGPLYFELEDAQFFNKDGQSLISVGSAALSFSRLGLLTGRIMPKAIILKQPSVRLTRHKDGSLDLGLGKMQAPQKERAALTTQIFEYIARPGAQSVRDSLVARLEVLRIVDAKLLINDRTAQQSWSLPDFNANFESTQLGMVGTLSVSLPDNELLQSKLSVDALYEWESKIFSVDLDVENVALQNLGNEIPALQILSDQDIVVNAHAQVLLGDDFLPTDLRINLESEEGLIAHEKLSDEAIPYEDLLLNVSYSHISKTARIENSYLSFEDVKVNVQSTLEINETGISGPMKFWLDPTEHKNILPLWPKVLEGEGAEEWVVKKISGGNIDALSAEFNLFASHEEHKNDAAVEGQEDDGWTFGISNVIAKFALSGASVDYRAPLTKATDVTGSGVLDVEKDDMRITISKAKIGSMRVKKADMYFDYLIEQGKGDADLSFDFDKASVADVLRYISSEPLDLGKDIGFKPEEVKGRADMNVKVRFPARDNITNDDIKIGVKAKVYDVLLPDVVDSLDLTGGPYDFSIQDNLAKVSGTGFLENRDVTLKYERFLESEGKPYKEKVSAKIIADPNLRTLLGIDLSDLIEGAVPVDVDYTSFRNRKSVANIRADLTPATFFVEPFGFVKKPSGTASASFKVHMVDGGKLQKISDLSASGDAFSIVGANIEFKNVNDELLLQSGVFPSFTLDQTQGVLHFEYDASRAVDISLSASKLDGRPFLEPAPRKDNDEYDEPEMRISVSAKELITAHNEALRDMIMYIEIDDQGRFNRLEADGSVGQGRLDLRFKQNPEGKRVFTLNATDGGALLKAMNVIKTVVGGTITVNGAAAHGIFDRSITGRAELVNFKVVDAPILAKMLGTLSLGGIGDVLRNEGLEFAKLEADFNWDYRKGGSLLSITEGRTSGNSLGLIFSGKIDNAKRSVDIAGTIVPMSGLNKFIGKIPLVGDILTGGSGVFAATYKIKGKSENPKISVNPLSVITPGIFRKLIFE